MFEPGLTESAVAGAVRIMDYDNIAISVLMVVACFEAILIMILLRALLRTGRQMAVDLLGVMESTKDAMIDIATALATLNERIGRHD